MKKKILIIGSNSFIAKNYITLSKYNKKILPLSTKDLKDLNGKFNTKRLKRIFKNHLIEIIINFTSNNNNSTSRFTKDSQVVLENISFHLEVLEFIKEKNISIIYFDSFEKYNSKNSSYKLSKKILENIYNFYRKKYKINVKKVLLPTVIGINDLNFNRLVPYLLKKILINKKISIKKQKKIIFTFVDNVIFKIDNIVSNSKKNLLLKKYEKKVGYFYSEFKKIHHNKKYQNKKFLYIYNWYKDYFKKQ